MSVFHVMGQLVVKAVKQTFKDAEFDVDLLSRITVEPPRDASHGDIATNAAMLLAKPLKMKPRDIAETLVAPLQEANEVASVTIAGPGFINMHLDSGVWLDELKLIHKEGVHYGDLDIGRGEKVNVEYVSANPTGPMHIGHARGAVFGDALAELLIKAGYDVTKEFYINDAGAQVDVLARSLFLRYREACGEEVTIPEGLYPGDYLVAPGEALKTKFGDSLLDKDESEWLDEVRAFALEQMLVLIKKDLADLGVEHEVFVSEKALQDSGKIEEGLDVLQKQDLVYKGILEAPKGQQPEDWEPREQVLFKSSQFGDDVDRPLQKSDGSWAYFASDIAYHLDKYQRGFNHMVVGLGVDHGGYVKRLQAAVKAVSGGKAVIDVKLYALVNFFEDGVPMKMSKRAGTFTTVRDVIDAVGKDSIRFLMLTRKNDMVLDFDLVKAKEQSKDNPVFYVQYAHARAHSVLRMAKDEAPKAFEQYETLLAGQLEQSAVLTKISTKDELQLIKRMAQWPRVVEAAARASEPHRIAFYLQDLAAEFHGLWNKGKDDTILRFIVPDDVELTAARLVMVKALSLVVASGLQLFNIDPVEEMR